MTTQIDKDEAAIYDRQIRLWGLGAQQRIQSSTILVAGMRALSDEICKNLALAGVSSITLLDSELVTEEDLGAQFFLSEEDIGKNRAAASLRRLQNLNPRVKIVVDEQDIKEKSDEFFTTFDIVCLIHSNADLITRVNGVRRSVGKAFYTADAFGWYGYIFCDLKEHKYIITNPQTKAQTDALQTYTAFDASQHKDFSKLRPKQLKRTLSPIALLILILFRFQKENGRSPTEKDAGILNDLKKRYAKEMGIPDEYPFNDELLSDLAHKLDTEIAPVSAILGGILAQEILKVLSANDTPLNNWYFYNGVDNTGIIQQL